MPVPNTETFSLRDVILEIFGSFDYTINLMDCYAYADALKFDANYGSKTMAVKQLYAFRNYNNISLNLKFYNWNHISDPRKIAPIGWHVATAAEWVTLGTYAVSHSGTSLTYAKALSSANGWNSSTNSGAPGNNQSLNNYLGFSANPSGAHSDGWTGDDAYGDSAIFFTSTENGEYVAYAIKISYDSNTMLRYGQRKTSNLSVRCVRDSGNSNMYAYDYDGNYYTAVTIGTQTWLVQNLCCNHYRNGDPIIHDYY